MANKFTREIDRLFNTYGPDKKIILLCNVGRHGYEEWDFYVFTHGSASRKSKAIDPDTDELLKKFSADKDKFECDIEIEVPKKDRTLTKRKVTISGFIDDWYKDEYGREHGPEAQLELPFHYATDKGKFPSWADAIKAGSNIKYGGSCNVGATKSVSRITIGDRYGYRTSKMTKEELKPIEKILLNIEKDNQKFLKDCHYKD